MENEALKTELDLFTGEEKAHNEKTKNQESHFRSIVKGITWRIIGTIDTMVISWFITGNVKMAAAIGGTEVFTKVFLFYLHERAWLLVPLGKTTGLFNFFNKNNR